jgi:hypothetical protein
MTTAEQENAANLQAYLGGWWWRKKAGSLTCSALSVNRKAMTFIEGDHRIVRNLSAKGVEYIRTGGALLADEEESYLEPE